MDKAGKAVEEKRRFPRIESNLPVQYKNLRNLSEASKGSLSRDIGEGGVRFKSNEFISLACRLVLEITLPTVSKPIKAISKVAWIKRVPASEQYELGNQFLDMTKEDKAHVMDFVSKTVNKNI